MKQSFKNLLAVGPLPVSMQRAALDLQLPIALLSGLSLVVASWLHATVVMRELVVVLFASLALVSVWLLRARLPVAAVQTALMMFILVAMWSGVSTGSDASAVVAAGIMALFVVGLSGNRWVRWFAGLLGVGCLIGAQALLPDARLNAAIPLLLCASLMALAIVALLRWQVRAQYDAQQRADLLLGEHERLLVEFRQRNDVFRRMLAKDADQKSLQLQCANDELREVNAHLESFNYMVSHDIRASLRILDGLAKVLVEDIDADRPAAARQNLGRLQNSIGHMHGMVQELLNMSKSGKTALQRRKVDLSAIVRELARDLQTAEPQRRVSVETPNNLYACAQPELIREALQNLLCNAWKFTAQRSDARIQFGVSDEHDGRVYYVRDNGVGIDMQRSAELFQPFKQLHVDQGYEGTGVGLASVKRIIERHGGRVWALAEPDRGARLCFTLGEPSANRCEDVANVG
jgi:signal transduction histidine kinase